MPQGTYVEGIKEEVVLSPGHALSFIAAGEGIHRDCFCYVHFFLFSLCLWFVLISAVEVFVTMFLLFS